MGNIYKFTEKETTDIINEYKVNFKSALEISKKYNVDCTVIKRVLKENKIEIINGSAFSVEYWKKRGLNEEQSLQKIKEMKPCIIDYWIIRGYDIDGAKLQVELHLMNTKRAYIIKYGEKIGVELYEKKRHNTGVSNSSRRTEHWLNKGFNLTESRKKVSECQNTWSKDFYTKKYGEIEGAEKMNERKEKWQNTLKSKINYSEIQKKKDSGSIDFLIKKHKTQYINEKIMTLNIFDEVIKNKIIVSLENTDYISFLNIIRENYEYDNHILRRICRIKLIQYIFNKEKNDILSDLIKLYPIKNKNSWGTVYSIDGILVRSLGELKIYRFLKKGKYDFEYDYDYPMDKKNPYKCDFYLKKNDYYIEYAGMLNIRKTDKTKRVLESYDTRLKIKKDICVSKNLKHYFSKSVDDIINFIITLDEEKH